MLHLIPEVGVARNSSQVAQFALRTMPFFQLLRNLRCALCLFFQHLRNLRNLWPRALCPRLHL